MYGAIGLQWIMLLFWFINAIGTGYNSWSRIMLRKVWWFLSCESLMYLRIIGACSGTSVFLSCKWIFNYVFTEFFIFSWKLEQLHNWEKSIILLFLDYTEPPEKQSQIAPSTGIVYRTFRSRLTAYTQKIIKGGYPYKRKMPSLVMSCANLGQAGGIQDHLLKSLCSWVCYFLERGNTQTLVCTLLRLLQVS